MLCMPVSSCANDAVSCSPSGTTYIATEYSVPGTAWKISKYPVSSLSKLISANSIPGGFWPTMSALRYHPFPRGRSVFVAMCTIDAFASHRTLKRMQSAFCPSTFVTMFVDSMVICFVASNCLIASGVVAESCTCGAFNGGEHEQPGSVSAPARTASRIRIKTYSHH